MPTALRILLDSSVGPRVADALRAHGHDVVRITTGDPGDDVILARAALESRVIVTADKDFGELVVHRRAAHVGIVRVVDHPISRHPVTIRAAIASYADELSAGAIVTVEPGRVRVRRGG